MRKLSTKPKKYTATKPHSEYKQFRGRDAHVRIYEFHHGRKVQPGYIVHHRDENKKNNAVCAGPVPCPKKWCGNLETLTRAAHILQHQPGRMGGRLIKNKVPPKVYHCSRCGVEKSRKGDVCQRCRWESAKDGLTKKGR